MKNFIANIPLFLGVGVKYLSDKLIDLSFTLHVTFRTESGKKLKELKKAADELIKSIKDARQSSLGASTAGDRKLVDIINRGTNGRAFTIGKKTTDN